MAGHQICRTSVGNQYKFWREANCLRHHQIQAKKAILMKSWWDTNIFTPKQNEEIGELKSSQVSHPTSEEVSDPAANHHATHEETCHSEDAVESQEPAEPVNESSEGNQPDNEETNERPTSQRRAPALDLLIHGWTVSGHGDILPLVDMLECILTGPIEH